MGKYYKIWWHWNQKTKISPTQISILINKIDINRIVVSNKVSLGKKYFIGYKNVKKSDLHAYFFKKWLHIEDTLMKVNTCIFDERWWIVRKIYWNLGKVRNSIKNEFDNEPLCNYKYLKTRIKPYHGKINIDFHNNKIPKEGSQCICLSVILIDSVFRTVNIIILKCFYKNVNILLRKKRCLSILLIHLYIYIQIMVILHGLTHPKLNLKLY